jgi:hypothetical protein
MAAMTTALTEFADNGNSRQYTYTGHTTSEPRLVLQKRRVPSSNTAIAEDTVSVISATEDALGNLLASKINFTLTLRRPINGIAADVTAALAIIRDVIAGDEYTNTTATQEWLI